MSLQKEETEPISIRLPKQIIQRIPEVLKKESFVNSSEYIRDLIRSDLRKRGLLD